MRPTCTFHTRAQTVRPAMSTEILSGRGRRAVAGGVAPAPRAMLAQRSARRGSAPHLAGHHRADGQGAEVVHAVLLVLPALLVELLGEVALVVEQADRHQGQVQPAGRLEMVAGQHAQAARVDGQAGGQAVLHAEVGDAQVATGPDGAAGTSPARAM